MKIKEGFVLREVADQVMVIAVGKASQNFKGMIKMNNTSKDIWNYIEEGLDIENIVSKMSDKYQADKDIIRTDVMHIIDVLRDNHILED